MATFTIGAAKAGINLPKNPFPIIPLLVWGDIIFKVSTIAIVSQNWNQDYNWAMKNRMGGRPVYQFTGIGEQSVNITGTIFGEFRFGSSGISTGNIGLPIGSRQLDDVLERAGSGAVKSIYDGRGACYGDWFITNINEIKSKLNNFGVARKQEFSITFKRDGNDALQNAHVSYTGLINSIRDAIKVSANPFRA